MALEITALYSSVYQGRSYIAEVFEDLSMQRRTKVSKCYLYYLFHATVAFTLEGKSQ